MLLLDSIYRSLAERNVSLTLQDASECGLLSGYHRLTTRCVTAEGPPGVCNHVADPVDTCPPCTCPSRSGVLACPVVETFLQSPRNCYRCHVGSVISQQVIITIIEAAECAASRDDAFRWENERRAPAKSEIGSSSALT